MKQSRSILDHAFDYVPAVATSVADTWRRFGSRPPGRNDRNQRGKHIGTDLVRRHDAHTCAGLPDAERRRALLDYLATFK